MPLYRYAHPEFQNLDSFPAAGMRVNRPLDKSVPPIQFAEDQRADRDGLIRGVDTLKIQGFRCQPLRRPTLPRSYIRP